MNLDAFHVNLGPARESVEVCTHMNGSEERDMSSRLSCTAADRGPGVLASAAGPETLWGGL